MQKLITLSIIAGLAAATPAIVLTQKPAVAQTAPTDFKGLDFYATEYRIVSGQQPTAKLTLHIRSQTSQQRRLTNTESSAIYGIRMLDNRTGETYYLSSVDGDLNKVMTYSGDTIKVKLDFELPQGIWPTHLELDTDTDQPLKIRL